MAAMTAINTVAAIPPITTPPFIVGSVSLLGGWEANWMESNLKLGSDKYVL